MKRFIALIVLSTLLAVFCLKATFGAIATSSFEKHTARAIAVIASHTVRLGMELVDSSD